MFAEIVLTLFYTSLFIWLIFKWKFFHFEGIRKIELSIIFIIKILAGVILAIIYTYYYKNREEADIFKFFDDSRYLFNAIYVNPIHYFQLVFGINADADYLKAYVHDTKFWALQTTDYWKFTATPNNNYFNSFRLITRFNAFVRLFSFGHYTVHTVFMCFISLIGLTALYKTFYTFLKENKKLLVFFVFFMPSVLLWSSGVLKEGFIFLGLGLFIYSFFDIVHNKISKTNILVTIFSFLLIAFVKYYLIVALIPAMLAYFISNEIKIKQKIYVYISLYGFVFLLLIITSFLSGMPNPIKILSDKQSELIRESYGGSYCYLRKNDTVKEIVYFPPDTKIEKTITDSSRNIFIVQPNIKAYKYKDGKVTDETILITSKDLINTNFWEIFKTPTSGSFIKIRELRPNILSFLKAVPFGLINVIFRPHLFEINSLMIFPAACENLLIFIFIVLCLFFLRIRKQDINLILFLFFSIFTLYIIIGITTPTLGAIVRYKSPLLPFMMVLLLLITDVKKLSNFFKINRKN